MSHFLEFWVMFLTVKLFYNSEFDNILTISISILVDFYQSTLKLKLKYLD